MAGSHDDRPGTRPRFGALVAAAVVVPAALAGLTALWPRPGIEAGLTTAAQESLRAAGVPGAVAFSGRDATVTGVTGTDGDRALAVVGGVTGVRVARLDAAVTGAPAAAPPDAQAEEQPTAGPDLPAEDELDAAARQALQDRITAAAPVTFAPDTAELTPEGAAALAQALSVLREQPAARVRVDGFVATNRGDGLLTAVQLSEQRAATVRQILVDGGVPADRVTARGLGEGDRPAADAAGRRVEIVLV